MAGIEKLLQKMKNRPNGIRFAEVERVLKHYGYILDRVKGSHYIFFNEETGDTLPVPKDNPVKAYIVKQVLKRIGE